MYPLIQAILILPGDLHALQCPCKGQQLSTWHQQLFALTSSQCPALIPPNLKYRVSKDLTSLMPFLIPTHLHALNRQIFLQVSLYMELNSNRGIQQRIELIITWLIVLINNTGAREIHWQASHTIPACEKSTISDNMCKKCQRWNLLINAVLLKQTLIINVNLIIAPC